MPDRYDRRKFFGSVGRVLLSLCVALFVSSGSAQFFPKPPRDPRGVKAQKAFDRGSYGEAAALLEPYLRNEPEDNDARLILGWSYYRVGEFVKAQAAFAEAVRRDPGSADARVGFGYSQLQTAGPDAAAAQFGEVLRVNPSHWDALEGMVFTGRRAGAPAPIKEAGEAASRKLEELARTGKGLPMRPELLPLGRERRLRPALPSSQPITIKARALRDYIEIADQFENWRPIFVKGFNLGVALPGRFATEFPTDDSTYREWLDIIAGFGANSIRTYTLLPPAFYRALVAHNQERPEDHLWLIQGVWTELPPDNNFSHEQYMVDFNAETARVIDAVHGNLVLGPRPGHAYGVYNTDASGSVLAYIIGREWEPFAVMEYNQSRPDETSWEGIWFKVENARAMECWVARVCDFAASYEAVRYRTLHPLTFANWPTLDPLTHPTEAGRTEEDRWRKHFGVPFPPVLKGLPWEDDGVSLDSTRISPTLAMKAGFFAAYHIYPNYPDFMNLEPSFELGRDKAGKNRYAAYLAALKQYHGTQPVIVAEFGMSTSRGIAHIHPHGWNHGGIDEREQGYLVGRMLENIHEANYAGGIVFEFMDEWFKGVWSVNPFESPSERRRMWFNAESPEESYGIMAARPASANIMLDGDGSDWTSIRPVLSR